MAEANNQHAGGRDLPGPAAGEGGTTTADGGVATATRTRERRVGRRRGDRQAAYGDPQSRDGPGAVGRSSPRAPPDLDIDRRASGARGRPRAAGGGRFRSGRDPPGRRVAGQSTAGPRGT